MASDTEFAREALSANNQTFTVDALYAAQVNTFDRILSRLSNQAGVQRNQETPAVSGSSPDGTQALYVSKEGYSRLFTQGPRILYVPEGEGATSRDPGAVDQGLIDQVVIHSFGYTIDRMAVAGGSRSIQVDSPEVGHNPYKLYNRLQQVLSQPRQSTTHLISRRGDIICATPWNRSPAVNRFRQLPENHVERRSISIELESWHTTYKAPYDANREHDFKVLGLMPYTSAQMIALAFLLRKLSTWANNVDMTYTLGFTRSEVSSKLGEGNAHHAGLVPVFAITGDMTMLGGEWVLPDGWTLGDPLPSWLQPQRALWDRRHDLYFRAGGVSEGTSLSPYTELKGLYDSMPVYDMATEVFENRDDAIFAAARNGDGTASTANASIVDAGEGYARAQSMQSAQRSGMYAASPIAVDAVVTAAYIAHAQRMAAAFTTPSIPYVRNAIAFDFEQAQWTVATVPSAPPDAPAPTAPAEAVPDLPPATVDSAGTAITRVSRQILNTDAVQRLGRL